MPKTTPQPSLTSECDGCRKPAVYYPQRYEDALEHLKALLQPLTTPWVAHWRARGLSEQEIEELLQEASELPEGTPQA